MAASRYNRRSSNGLTPLGKLLDGTRRASAARAGHAFDQEVWLKLVGRRIAERAAPGGLSQGVLIIEVASAAWAQELSLLSDELLKRIATTGLEVRELRFRVTRSPLPSIEHAPRKRLTPEALSAELREKLAAIDDPELQRAVADAAAHSLALDKTRQQAAEARAAKRKKPKRG